MGAIAIVAALVLGHTITYDGSVLPDDARPPWSYRETANCSAVVQDGVLHVQDRGTAKGELQFISYSWGAIPTRPHSVEARVKVGHCSSQSGVILLAANGVREVGLTLYPDRIEIHPARSPGKGQSG